MRAAYDPGSQGPGAMIHQFIDQSILATKDEGNPGFGIEVKLQKGVELGKDLDAHEVGFIEDQDGLLFFGSDFEDKAPEGFGQEGDGEGARLYLEREEDLLEQFKDGSGVGRDGNDPVLGGVKRGSGIAEGGGFAGTDFSGNDIQGAQFEGVEESVCEGLETWQGVKIINLDILSKGFSLKAKEVLIESHRQTSFRRVSPPDRMGWQRGVKKAVGVGCRCGPRFV
jgi:hypothetical protein